VKRVRRECRPLTIELGDSEKVIAIRVGLNIVRLDIDHISTVTQQAKMDAS